METINVQLEFHLDICMIPLQLKVAPGLTANNEVQGKTGVCVHFG